MTYFDEALIYVLANEGGYVNDPSDPGGETNFGISAHFLSTCSDAEPLKHKPLREWVKKDASAIYKKYFWKNYFNEILFEPLAIKIFDHSVNMGIARAVCLVQQACNKLITEDNNNNLIKKSFLIADGIFGEKTLSVINSFAGLKILNAYIEGLVDYYTRLAKRRPSQQKDLNGWLARAHKIPEVKI
jgi:lysozyme family protein